MGTQAQFRLLVVRLGAMGDVLHALPGVAALRKAHPGWKIDWAIEPHWLPLLTAEPENALPGAPRTAERPIVDQIHLVPAKAWGKRPLHKQTWNEIRQLRQDLRAANYDAVLDMQGSIRSGVVSWLTGCRRVVGMAAPRETPAKWFYSDKVQTKGAHVIEQGAELADALAGDLLTPVAPALPVDAEAEFWCDDHQELKSAIWMNKPVVLIDPGGGWGAKRWPAKRYGAVAEEFAVRGGRGSGQRRTGGRVVGERSGCVVGNGLGACAYRRLHGGSVDRADAAGFAGDWRGYGAGASGVFAGQAGCRDLRADRSKTEWPLRNALPGFAQSGKPHRSQPARRAGSRPAHDYSGGGHRGGRRPDAG